MAAAVIRGSATRSPRLLARAARISLSSRPMLAAITAVLSRRSGLIGSMGAFCKGASGWSWRSSLFSRSALRSSRSAAAARFPRSFRA